jgi:curved DNA-binding protein CbpA
MKGQLSQQPLTELIREICDKKLSGSLRVEHEQSKVVVYFEEGSVVYAASNVRNLRLIEYLKKKELLSDSQLEKYSSKRSDLALAREIAADCLLPQSDLTRFLENLTADALRLALLWFEGTWDFDERARLSDPIRVHVDTATLLLESARKADPKLASGRFTMMDELISQGSGYSTIAGLLPEEGFLLSRVEGDIKLSELVALSGLREADALRTVYGLILAGFLKRENWNQILRRTRRETVVEPPKPIVPPAPVAPQRSEEEDLQDFLLRMDGAVSYYEVLDVRPDELAENIKQAYYGVARKYHPDRFRGDAHAALHARLESAFARITQAYETLMDANRRKGYDAKLAAQRKAKDLARTAPKATVQGAANTPAQQGSPQTPSEVDKKQIETTFQEGFAALQQGQLNLAIGFLAAAARATPDEARYRAYYGRALAAREKTRRSGEAELLAAIRLDPNSADYRIMLAELYSDLGFARRALAEAERALAIDPNNQGAKDLVRKLK